MLLHTLSHLLIQSLAMRCGYPASSIRERIYADTRRNASASSYTPGAQTRRARSADSSRKRGTSRIISASAADGRAVLQRSDLCATCARDEHGKRWLHGAACHGCALVAETSCEMRNDYLDRALVVPVLGVLGAAFFGAAE